MRGHRLERAEMDQSYATLQRQRTEHRARGLPYPFGEFLERFVPPARPRLDGEPVWALI